MHKDGTALPLPPPSPTPWPKEKKTNPAEVEAPCVALLYITPSHCLFLMLRIKLKSFLHAGQVLYH